MLLSLYSCVKWAAMSPSFTWTVTRGHGCSDIFGIDQRERVKRVSKRVSRDSALPDHPMVRSYLLIWQIFTFAATVSILCNTIKSISMLVFPES